MTGAVTESNQEAAVLEAHQNFLHAQPRTALSPLQEAAIERFEQLGFPHPKHEMFTFVNTHELTHTVFSILPPGQVDSAFLQSLVYPACRASVIVFVDGVYDSSLSNTSALPAGVALIRLEDALESPDIKDHLLHTLENENDVFACLNGAFMTGGLLVDVAGGVVADAPLQVLYLSTGADNGPRVHHPRLMLRLGRRAELKWAGKFAGTGGGYLVNAVQDLLLGEGAGMVCSVFQQDPAEAWHLSKMRVFQNRDSRFTAHFGASGSRVARMHHEVRLREEGAELNLMAAAVLCGREQAHHFVRIHHEAPHCTSHQHFKNVVGDNGRASVDGTVIVNQGAQLTSSDQLINNLMLSDGAHADNKPNLMIFADDVKCTHGTTVGRIDEDQLFYLKTRGLQDELARRILTTSFIESLIEQIPFEDVVRDMHTVLLGKLETANA